MGLDASVRCNCVKEGKAQAHPFPEFLVFDGEGEPTLKGVRDTNFKLWSKHDKWYRDSCPHSGYLVEKRLGNMFSVACIREFLQNNSPSSFQLLLERVVYNGTHTGDRVSTSDVPQLLTETRTLQAMTRDPSILQFTNDVIELAEASLSTGNPIVF